MPRADRDSGRSQQGYWCNLTRIGQYQGDGATWVQPSYDHCSYIGSFASPSSLTRTHRGVQVLDVTDERNPRFSAALESTAMLLGTWETLKVDPVHGYLAAVGTPVPPGTGATAFDLYDIKTDCAHPRLLNGLVGSLTIPTLVFGHEGVWAPDGNTYYALADGAGALVGIDVSSPTNPRVLGAWSTGLINHGASISPDGRTMYGVTLAGAQVLDISDFQDRKPLPQARQIGAVTWSDGLLSQHTINFTRDGHPYLYAIDEAGGGGVRLIDIADPTQPRVVRQYRLEINQPENNSRAAADTGGDGIFVYDAHYCSIDRQVDPTMLACSYFQSGVRLFDITDPMNPRELAYYNPPAQVGRQAGTTDALVNSPHAWAVNAPAIFNPSQFNGQTLVDSLSPSMTTDWCSSPPTFRPNNTLWVTCQDNGFQVLKYKPLNGATTPTPTPSTTAPADREHSDDDDDDSDDDDDANGHHRADRSSAGDGDTVPRIIDSGLKGGNSALVMLLTGLGATALLLGTALVRRRWID